MLRTTTMNVTTPKADRREGRAADEVREKQHMHGRADKTLRSRLSRAGWRMRGLIGFAPLAWLRAEGPERARRTLHGRNRPAAEECDEQLQLALAQPSAVAGR